MGFTKLVVSMVRKNEEIVFFVFLTNKSMILCRY